MTATEWPHVESATHHSVYNTSQCCTVGWLVHNVACQILIQINKFTLQPPWSLKNHHISLMTALLNVHHEKWHKIMQRHRGTRSGGHGKVKSQWDWAGGWPGEAHLRVAAADGGRSRPSSSPAFPPHLCLCLLFGQVINSPALHGLWLLPRPSIHRCSPPPMLAMANPLL